MSFLPDHAAAAVRSAITATAELLVEVHINANAKQ